MTQHNTYQASREGVRVRLVSYEQARAVIVCFGFLALGLAGAPSAEAACNDGGTTVTAVESLEVTQTLGNGETCTIEQDGSISTIGDDAHGIDALSNNTITNSGSIRTTGENSVGISVGSNNTITNSGSISTTGGKSAGIHAFDNNTITNSGSISTAGEGGAGIHAFSNNTITNNGLISMTGDNATGISALDNNTITNSGNIITTAELAFGIAIDDNNTISNSGSISTTGDFATGISAIDNNAITNSGLISTAGENSDGIFAFNNNAITNSGLISTTGENSDGIDAFGDDNTISNSGLISATGAGSYAIDFFGGDGNELVLLPGSRIIGRISLGTGSDTITFKNRLSTVLTFDDDDGNGVPEAINANGLPYVVSGTSVAVLDPSGFNQHDEMLSDLTSGIFNSVHARLAGAGTPRAPQRVGKGFAEPVVRTNTAVWAQVFGGWRDQDDTGPTHGAKHNLVGGIAGLDGLISPTLRLGAFGGLARDDVTVNFNSQDIDADSYFGGVYASFQNNGWFANMILTAGQTDHDSRRTVLFNLSDTGVQIGRANYDGTFISPEVAIGTRFAAGYVAIEPSVRLRYAHMSLDGYSETGAEDALSVRSRDISLWQGRAQIAFPMAASLPGGGVTHFAPRIGIEAWTADNDTVSAVLLGESISFNPGGKDDEVTGFVGATASVDIANGASAVIDMEVHGGEEGIVRSEARAGVTINF
jgi:hypothetical protein